MQGELNEKVEELVASTERREFLRDPEAITKAHRSEEVKFWTFVRPYVHEIQNALANWYIVYVEANSRIDFKYAGGGGVASITTLNVNFAKPGTLTLSFSHDLGSQIWSLRMVEANSFRWRNYGTADLHIEGVAEQALTWFLEVTMQHMAKNGMIER
jgi:hypothetical protein